MARIMYFRHPHPKVLLSRTWVVYRFWSILRHESLGEDEIKILPVGRGIYA